MSKLQKEMEARQQAYDVAPELSPEEERQLYDCKTLEELEVLAEQFLKKYDNSVKVYDTINGYRLGIQLFG